MVSVNISTYLSESDPLLVARNAIYLALFERVALECRQQVVVDRDKDYIDSHLDLTVALAREFLHGLKKLDLLRHITIDVSSEEECAALSEFANEAAFEVL